MTYNARKPGKSVKSEWRMRAADFETGEPSEVIRSYGGPEKKEIVGKWISDDVYISISGTKSRGGMPYKLWTRDEPIPISPTDASMLVKAHLIRRVRK
ncbi:hypothetical protein ACSAZL_14350 [Methanosarcina sp. T3]|uniref:hypothetical protein n=1 Tax=Methanosarcina sp. T3 TaxID=3439062 RepID=UPI003F836508